MRGNLLSIDLTEVVEAVKREVESEFFDRHYPVGCIYMTMSDKSPADTFSRGTWERLAAGRALVGVDPDSADEKLKTVGNIFGEGEHTLTEDEMPAHSHSVFCGHQAVEEETSETVDSLYYRQQEDGDLREFSVTGKKQLIGSAGGSAAHNNYQPSFTCHIWQRTA